MSHARRPGRSSGALAAALALTLGAACGGGTAVSDPQATPVPPHGAPTAVEVCDLVAPQDAERAVGRSLRQVGLEYAAARVPTLACDLGRAFADPELSVELAIGPISRAVFEDAYGDPAGGDPVLVKRLGQAAFIRTETGEKSIHVLVHGSILGLRATIGQTDPIGRSALVQLAETVVARLPSNPVLAPTDAGQRCRLVPLASVTAAIGAQPSLFSHFDDPDGSVRCSWAALPGAAVVSVVRAPHRLASYRRLAASEAFEPVRLGAAAAGVTAVSRTDRAGDLLILTGNAAVVISVMPTAGFSNSSVKTTPGETRLAAEAIAALASPRGSPSVAG